MDIWFVFNLVGIFIYNKNIVAPERIWKFIAWVGMSQVAYPANPYMAFFLGMAYVIAGEERSALAMYDVANGLLDEDPSWRGRLASFGLVEAIRSRPGDPAAVRATIEELRAGVAQWWRK